MTLPSARLSANLLHDSRECNTGDLTIHQHTHLSEGPIPVGIASRQVAQVVVWYVEILETSVRSLTSLRDIRGAPKTLRQHSRRHIIRRISRWRSGGQSRSTTPIKSTYAFRVIDGTISYGEDWRNRRIVPCVVRQCSHGNDGVRTGRRRMVVGRSVERCTQCSYGRTMSERTIWTPSLCLLAYSPVSPVSTMLSSSRMKVPGSANSGR